MGETSQYQTSKYKNYFMVLAYTKEYPVELRYYYKLKTHALIVLDDLNPDQTITKPHMT